MFEYELYRVHFDHRKKKWINDGSLGIFDSLDKALNAQAYDKTLPEYEHYYYIEHRIKLDYDGRRN